MGYRFEVKINPELLKNTKINDEYIYRDIARKMVSEMPLDVLHKLINLTKLDPSSEESKKVLRENIDRLKIERIHQLRSERVIMYEGFFNA